MIAILISAIALGAALLVYRRARRRKYGARASGAGSDAGSSDHTAWSWGSDTGDGCASSDGGGSCDGGGD